MRGARVVMVLLGLGVLAAVASVMLRPSPPASPPSPASPPATATMPAPARPPRPPSANPADDRLGALALTPEQQAALLAAGRAIQNGVTPSTVLTPEERATLPDVQKKIIEAVCPSAGDDPTCGGYRIDVERCLDRAGEIVTWRRKERDAVDRKLFTAAMGVSVTGREYPSYLNLVKFCRDMAALDVKPTKPAS